MGAESAGVGVEMTDAYHDDLAAIHDAGYGHFARAAGPVLLGELRRRGVRDGLVIDLGCGSGILAAELTAAGYDVLGFDLSPAMIALARKRAPKARFRRQSLWAAELPVGRSPVQLQTPPLHRASRQSRPARQEV